MNNSSFSSTRASTAATSAATSAATLEETIREGFRLINNRLEALERSSPSSAPATVTVSNTWGTTRVTRPSNFSPQPTMTGVPLLQVSSSQCAGYNNVTLGSVGSGSIVRVTVPSLSTMTVPVNSQAAAAKGPYEEHRRIFGYSPSVTTATFCSGHKRKGKGFQGGGRKKEVRVEEPAVWRKEVACLRFRSSLKVPGIEEKMVMARMGLGSREILFDLDGDELYLHEKLLSEFPILKGGGYTLLRTNTNSTTLLSIEWPRSGLTIKYLKEILCSARLYVRPLQFDIEEPSLENRYDADNPDAQSHQIHPFERCLKCHNSFPLSQLQFHLDSCKGHDKNKNDGPCSSQIINENTSDVIDQSGSHCDEEIEIQLAIDASLKETKDKPREKSVTLTELLNEHGPIKKLMEDAYDLDKFQIIAVSRETIWNDIRLFFKNHPKVEIPIRVEFKGEMAIDEGGPKREFFRLGLSTVFKDNTLFSGSRQHRIPTRNASAVLVKAFIHVGWLMALSIAQGGPGPKCLAEWVYSYIENGLYDAVVHITDIPTLDVQDLLTQLQKAVTNEDVQEALKHSHSSIIYDAGFVIPFSHITLENVQDIIRTVCIFTTILPIKGELDQLIEGLKLFDILGLIRSHGSLMKPLFIYKKNRLTAAEFKNFSHLKYSTLSQSQVERRGTEYWNHFLSELEDGLIGKTHDHYPENVDPLSLEDLLCFISGAKSIPPLEFNFSIEVTFSNDFRKVYPKASTCIPSISLPCHPSYEDFKAAMVEAIVGGGEMFGQL